MLPHSYRDLFQGAPWHPIWVFATFWISPALWLSSPLVPNSPFLPNFDIFANFAKIATYQGALLPSKLNRQPSGKILPFSPKSLLSEGALLASSLNREPCGNFRHFHHPSLPSSPKSPFLPKPPPFNGPLLAYNLNRQPSGDFPPFSSLHAFLDINEIFPLKINACLRCVRVLYVLFKTRRSFIPSFFVVAKALLI